MSWIVDYNIMQIDEELRRYSDPMIGIFTCLTAHHTTPTHLLASCFAVPRRDCTAST